MYPNDPNQQTVKDVWSDEPASTSNHPPYDLTRPLDGELPLKPKRSGPSKRFWIITAIIVVFLGAITVLAVVLVSLNDENENTGTNESSQQASVEVSDLVWKPYGVQGWTEEPNDNVNAFGYRRGNGDTLRILSTVYQRSDVNASDTATAENLLRLRVEEYSQTNPSAKIIETRKEKIATSSGKTIEFTAVIATYRDDKGVASRNYEAAYYVQNKVFLISYTTPAQSGYEAEWKQIVQNVVIDDSKEGNS